MDSHCSPRTGKVRFSGNKKRTLASSSKKLTSTHITAVSLHRIQQRQLSVSIVSRGNSGRNRKQLLKRICDYEEQFRGIFSPEQQKAFEDYENATISVTAISEEASFVEGFRLGTKMMLEVLQFV